MDFIIYAAVGAALAAAVFFVVRSVRRSRRQTAEVLPFRHMGPHSPITRLSFEESLNVDTFNRELRNFSLDYVNEALKELYVGDKPGADSVKLVEDVKLALDSKKILWKLSREGQKILKKIDMKRLNKAGGYRVARIADIAANVARIVAGIDQSGEFKSLEGKLDYLTASRNIDRLSKLESNYYLAKELLGGPLDATTVGKIVDLHREVVEIRTAWRNEIEHKLDHIHDPKEASILGRLLAGQKAGGKQVADTLARFDEEIALIDFSFIYDIALCAAVGHQNSSLSAEIERLGKTRDMLREKSTNLPSTKNRRHADNQVRRLDRIILKYKKFLPAAGGESIRGPWEDGR